MTQARDRANGCLDTIADVVRRSGRGTARQSVRVGEDLWRRFGELAEPDRSAVIREFIRWYVGEAKEPPRPPRP